IADVLLDRTTPALDHLGYGARVRTQDAANSLGIAPFCNGGRADQVGEQDCDHLALFFGTVLDDGTATRRAEAGSGRNGRTAGRTARESGSADRAEAGIGSGWRSALRTGRRHVPESRAAGPRRTGAAL